MHRDPRPVDDPRESRCPGLSGCRARKLGGVWIGDAARADVSQIPETIAVTDPGWHIGTGYLDYAANYQLTNDNLLDLSRRSSTKRRWAREPRNRRPNARR